MNLSLIKGRHWRRGRWMRSLCCASYKTSVRYVLWWGILRGSVPLFQLLRRFCWSNPIQYLHSTSPTLIYILRLIIQGEKITQTFVGGTINKHTKPHSISHHKDHRHHNTHHTSHNRNVIWRIYSTNSCMPKWIITIKNTQTFNEFKAQTTQTFWWS